MDPISSSNETTNKIVSSLLDKHYNNFMVLKIYVNKKDLLLKDKYVTTIRERNEKLLKDLTHESSTYCLDAGFDLFTPKYTVPFECGKVNQVDFNIKCSARMYSNPIGERRQLDMVTTGFYMYPRSSLSKTRLRLANCVGIIDAGYRGPLIGMFDVLLGAELHDTLVYVENYMRLVQICAPGLVPIIVELVNDVEELGTITERGEGGLGSTGL